MATELQIAWAAGFFDGEGSVVAYRGRSSGRTRDFFVLKVSVAQRDIATLEKFNDIFENTGKIYLAHNKHGHTWGSLVYSSRKGAAVLRRLLPYLVFKKRVAELGISLQESVENSRNRSTKALPPGVWEEREDLGKQIRWENTGRWLAAETKPEEMQTADKPILH